MSDLTGSEGRAVEVEVDPLIVDVRRGPTAGGADSPEREPQLPQGERAELLPEERLAKISRGLEEQVDAARAKILPEEGERFENAMSDEMLERVHDRFREVVEYLPTRFQGDHADAPAIQTDVCVWTDQKGEMYPVPVLWVPGKAIAGSGVLNVAAGTFCTPEGVVDPTSRSSIRAGGWHPNLIYFPRAYCFHPGAIAEDDSGGKADILTGALQRTTAMFNVMTVDTGMAVNETYTNKMDEPFVPTAYGDGDLWDSDAFTGHGPAIADLIGDLIGDNHRSHLTSMDYASGNGRGYFFEYDTVEETVDATTGKKEVKNVVRRVRGFTAASLLSTLKSLQGDFEILNLSLGTTECPDEMVKDPICDWIVGWLKAAANRKVVVAAGNHGTPVPSWPAAITKYPAPCTNSADLVDVRPRFYSVGSADYPGESAADPNQKNPTVRDVYSGHGDWVTCWRPGHRVGVAHHDFPTTVWTGTSFAAPQVAAELAMNHERLDIEGKIAAPKN